MPNESRRGNSSESPIDPNRNTDSQVLGRGPDPKSFDKGYNDTIAFSFTPKQVKELLDKMSGVPLGRRTKPHMYEEYIDYPHRVNFDDFNIRIGDCCFVIPPDYISVKEITSTERTVSIRQESSLKRKHGYVRREVRFTAFFNGLEQINGYAVKSPMDYLYYVDGLRPLLAQSKCMPFLPVKNEYLNLTCDIHNIAIQSITVSTVPNFPDCLQATIIAQEFNAEPYIQAPNLFYDEFIDWDLFRYQYQQLLKDNSTNSRALAKIKYSNNDISTFSLINEDKLKGVKTDEDLKFDNEDMFEKFVSNDEDFKDNFSIAEMNFGYSNILTFMQLSGHESPTMQYLGGNDIVINLVIETTDSSVVAKFHSLLKQSQNLVRKLKDFQNVGFIKIDNDLLKILGTQYLLIEDLTSSTVPDFPGSYILNLQCVSYDLVTKNKNNLIGFKPFENDRKGTKNDAITQGPYGLLNKIKQDTEAEKRMLELELYPDLFLPKYSEIDEAIKKIRDFRTVNGLGQYHISDNYPRKTADLKIEGKDLVYENFLDPDFYMFYPFKYTDIEDEDNLVPMPNPPKADKVDVTVTYEFEDNGSSNVNPGSSGSGDVDLSKVTGGAAEFVKLLLSQEGNGYVWGANGQTLTEGVLQGLIKSFGPSEFTGVRKWMGKTVFDCSGFIAWGMYKMGVTKSLLRPYHMDLLNYCDEVNKSELQPGDLLFASGHIACYIGNGETIEAMDTAHGVCRGKVSYTNYTKFGRIKAFKNSSYTVPITARKGQMSSDTGETDSSYSESKQLIGKFNKIYTDADRDKFDSIIIKYCQTYSLDANWLKALMKQESNLNPNSQTPYTAGKYATGLMQLTHYACESLGIPFDMTKLKDPEYNIANGTKYFASILSGYKGNYEYAICAYNMGIGGFNSYLAGKRSLPKETQTHITKVKEYYAMLLKNGGTTSPYYGDSGNGNSLIGSNGGSQTTSIKKQHGSRALQYTGEYGKPQFEESPLNAFLRFADSELDGNGDSNRNFFKDFYDSLADGNILDIFVKTLQTETGLNEIIKSKGLSVLFKKLFDLVFNTQQAGEMAKAKNTIATSIDFNGEYDKFLRRFLDIENEKELERSLVDLVCYSNKGTMLRAFPSYAFMICDESYDWLDGRKLWTNYYLYKSVVDIKVNAAKDNPVHTAILNITNQNQKLTKMPGDDYLYESLYKNIQDDPEYGIRGWLYKHTGIFLGSPKVTQQVVDVKNEIVRNMKLQTGARIHVRMGYGSNPLVLPISFNGTITEMTVGDVMTLVAQSDGVELINNVISTKKDEVNKLSKLQEEPSNIISSLLTDKTNQLLNMINPSWGEKNLYGIEHFGTPITPMFESKALTLNFNSFEYDICKNLYLGKYEQSLFCLGSTFLNIDGEQNIQMYLYNKTPWDTMQVTTQSLPEFVCQPVYHQFDSRMYFGLPCWPYKYRYDYDKATGKVYETAKTFSQFHYVDTASDIIDNQIRCTTDDLYTNVIATYTISGDVKVTPVLYSDKNIEWSKQRTKVVDTTVLQDRIFWDKLWKALGYNAGKYNAINIGLSNLIDSYERMYTGEIIVIGNPSIKPCDKVMIYDTYAEMTGLVEAREVTHMFGVDTGLITNITPGLIGYSKGKDSGATNVLSSSLFLGMAMGGIKLTRFYTTTVVKVFGNIVSLAKKTKDFATATKIYESVKTAKIVKNGANLYKETLDTVKTYKAIKSTINIVNGIKGGAIAFSEVAVPIIGPIAVWVISTILINTVLEGLIDYFSYNNCIGVRPLMYKGRPFVTGVKGQKNLVDGMTESNTDYKEEKDTTVISSSTGEEAASTLTGKDNYSGVGDGFL